MTQLRFIKRTRKEFIKCISNLLKVSRVVIDSGLRGDQTNKITGLVRESSTALAAKFSAVIS
jgi:hypothetical protein